MGFWGIRKDFFFQQLTAARFSMWRWLALSRACGAWSLPAGTEESASHCGPIEEVVKLYEDALAFNELQEGSWALHLLHVKKPIETRAGWWFGTWLIFFHGVSSHPK